jgi:hypothetical protein
MNKFIFAMALLAASATQADGMMPIPDVVDHNEYRTVADIQEVCQRLATEEERPCTVVRYEDGDGKKVCFAGMHMDGSSDDVQCYKQSDERFAAQQ